MKKVVIDHNILYSAISSQGSLTRQKLISSQHTFYTPNYLIVELFKHRPRIVAKSKATEEEVLSFLNQVLSKIHFFNEELISTSNFIEAFHLCKDVDENDTTYVALVLELEAEFWTRDEVLKEGLKQKGFNNFFEENKK